MDQITEVSFLAFVWAFLAGLASFLSPCVLPLLPGYLSFVSGVGIDELGARTRKVVMASSAFVIGFVFLFSLQGAVAGGIGESLSDIINPGGVDHRILEVLGGAILIIFGIFALGIVNPVWLQRERRLRLIRKPASLVGVVLAGMVFSVGIGPCTGPLLGSIYMLAIGTQNPGTGASLMFVYALGMGLPFVVSGLLFTKMIGTFSFIKKHFMVIKIASGVLLILFGLLLISGEMDRFRSWFDWMPNLDRYT